MQIDRAKAIKELGISTELLNELLGIFVEQAESTLKIMSEVVDKKDYEQIRKSAHFIKGSAGNLRIDTIQEIAREIELGAIEKQGINIIEGHVDKLRIVFEEVKKEVYSG